MDADIYFGAGRNIKLISTKSGTPISSWRPTNLRPDSILLTPSQAYRDVPYVYRCVSLRAQTIAALPFEIYDLATKKPSDLILGQQTKYSFKESGIADRLLWQIEAGLCLYGQAYWFKVRNPKRILELQPVSPGTMTPLYDSKDGLIGFERKLKGGGKPERLSLDEVVYFWLPNVMGEDGSELGPGTAPVEPALTSASLVKALSDFGQAFFEHGAIPAVILSVEGNPPQTELDRLERWWKRMVSGVWNAFKTIAVRAQVKAQIVGMPVKDLAMPELSEVARSHIAVALGVPETMLTDAANFGTASTHIRSFYRETIMPEAAQIQAVLNLQLFNPLGLYFEFLPKRIPALQKEEAEKGAFVADLYAPEHQIVTLNEAREMIGMPPVAGGDDAPISPEEFAEMGRSPGNPRPKPASASPGEGSGNVTNPSARSIDDLDWSERRYQLATLHACRTEYDMTGKVSSRTWGTVMPGLRRLIEPQLQTGQSSDTIWDFLRAKNMARQLHEDYLSIKIELDALAHLPTVLSNRERYRGKTADQLDTDMSVAHMMMRVRHTTVAMQQEMIRSVVSRLMVIHGYDCDPDRLEDEMEGWGHSDHTIFLSDQVKKRTMKALVDVGRSMTDEDCEEKWRRAWSRSSLLSLVSTETTRAYTNGVLIYRDLLRQRGIPVHAIWDSTDESEHCPDCTRLHGRSLIDLPDHRSGPPAHIGCRCSLRLEFLV